MPTIQDFAAQSIDYDFSGEDRKVFDVFFIFKLFFKMQQNFFETIKTSKIACETIFLNLFFVVSKKQVYHWETPYERHREHDRIVIPNLKILEEVLISAQKFLSLTIY